MIIFKLLIWRNMKFNCLIPELRVTDLKESKDFYVDVLGFEVTYERFDFAMVILGECQIMLQQLTLPSKEQLECF